MGKKRGLKFSFKKEWFENSTYLPRSSLYRNEMYDIPSLFFPPHIFFLDVYSLSSLPRGLS